LLTIVRFVSFVLFAVKCLCFRLLRNFRSFDPKRQSSPSSLIKVHGVAGTFSPGRFFRPDCGSSTLLSILTAGKFKSGGPVAQGLEQATHNRLVAGSNPAGPTIHKTLN
jgi:hypothetical protein